MTLKVLKTSAALVGILAAPAFAGSYDDKVEDTSAEVEMEQTEIENEEVAAEAEVEVEDTPTVTATAETTQLDNAITEEAQDLADATADTMDTMIGDDADSTEMTVAELVGKNVLTSGDEIVGEIDYVIDQGDGYAAVIGIGGLLGLGEYTVAVPLSEFSMTGEEELRLASWTEAELEALPEIDESELEELPSDYEISTSL
ncbi:PRC-barrel domain-containing protein [uncultured Tateyamaria sp.]|uniref:PRC-barrel domain-containing protein n=1 Tax=uncultured Tateyamaria sp. TaxID=455651 RepID=UPI00261A3190|nr:PRC-barrel domain-containing protein [uncultured Tateyamaria sp.]